MNPYLSRAEKETFVRLTSLAGLQEQIIDTYSNGNNADKEFLKFLRTSKTWLMKALDYRTSFLDGAASVDLAKQVSKLDLIFVPNDVAKREYEKLKEIKSHIHMPIEDFEDWYSEVIEHTCKTCVREDFEQCAMRRVMAKHGVFPANPSATNTCQFSYVDADPADLPEPSQHRQVEEEQTSPKLETKQQERDAATIEETLQTEQPNSGNDDLQETVSAEITLASGVQIDFYLTPYMAKQLLLGMQSMPKQSRPICASHVGDELIAIDTQDISIFRVQGIGECDLEQGKTRNMNPLTSGNVPVSNQNATSSKIETAAYKIECKCGAEYVCYLGSDRYKARCRECSAFVFRDEAIKEPLDDGKEANLMTNRYFVPRDEGQFNKREIKHQTPKLEQGEYQDPCRIFD